MNKKICKLYFAFRKAFLTFAKTNTMAETTKNKGLMWILFFISTAAFLFAIVAHWPWLTLILPFVTTFFVKAMDII